jgi:hypothetical protein
MFELSQTPVEKEVQREKREERKNEGEGRRA